MAVKTSHQIEYERQQELLAKQQVALKEINKLLSDKRAIEQQITDELTKTGELGKTEEERQQAIYKGLQDRLALLKIQQALLKDVAALHPGEWQALTDQIAKTKVLLEQQKKITEQLERQDKTINSFSNTLAKLLGMARKPEDTWIGGLAALLSKKQTTDAAEKFTKSMKELFDYGNIGASMMSKSLKLLAGSTVVMIKEAASVFAEMNKKTGFGGDYNKKIMQLREETVKWGGSLKTASTALTSLFENMGKWSLMSERDQDIMLESNSLMQGLGIEAATAAEAADLFVSSMGMTAAETAKASKSMNAFAIQMKMGPNKVMQDFIKTAPRFIAFGKDMEIEFKRMAGVAKQLQVDMGGLMGLLEQFDTFEGAATAVGKLNSALGGPFLDTVMMIKGTDSQRIMAISSAIASSGKNWMAMNRAERQWYAEALGTKDLKLAQRIFGANPAELAKYATALDNGTMSIEEMGKQIAGNIDPFDQFKEAIKSLAIAAVPLLNMLTSVVKKMAEHPAFVKFIAIALGVAGAAMAIGKAMIMASVGFGGLFSALAGALPALAMSMKFLLPIAGIIGGIAVAFAIYKKASASSTEAEAKRAEMTLKSVEAVKSLSNVQLNMVNSTSSLNAWASTIKKIAEDASFKVFVEGMTRFDSAVNAAVQLTPVVATAGTAKVMSVASNMSSVSGDSMKQLSETVRGAVIEGMKQVEIKLDNEVLGRFVVSATYHDNKARTGNPHAATMVTPRPVT